MGDLSWQRHHYWTYPLKALRYHAVVLGASGSGKTETLLRLAYGARKAHQMQVIYLDAKGETKRDDEKGEDNAARFVAAMRAAGAQDIAVFPATYYNGWQGSALELKNRLLAVVDYSESAYYGDVAANIVDLAFSAPTTPRSSSHFLANLRLERLKAIYQHDPNQYQRVLHLDPDLLKQVEMRYLTFFRALDGQLDGGLDYAHADAVYLRIRGFALRNEAPRLGRFLIADFMHYLAERRRPGQLTLLIIDEFNALRMREETSILLEQARSFGGCVIISSQGYAGLGPREYADRILDACSTYILHTCSDPFQITRRAGKRFRLDTSWSESQDEEEERRGPNLHIRPGWDWRIREQEVLQQETGQAYWIYRGRAQQVQTARVPITEAQIQEAWDEIRRQEAAQQALREAELQRRREKRASQQQKTAATAKPAKSAPETRKKRSASTSSTAPTPAAPQPSIQPAASTQLPPESPLPAQRPMPDPDDDEPDRL